MLRIATDECEGPSDFKDLADNSGYGLNVNGSVCLNNICMCVPTTSFHCCAIHITLQVGERHGRPPMHSRKHWLHRLLRR